MKAITVRQPWASLIAAGVKTIETRSWSTKYRGPLAIHAGKAKPDGPWEGGEWAIAWECHPPHARIEAFAYRHILSDRIDLPRGAVVATCTLADVVPIVDRWPTILDPRCLYNGPDYGTVIPGHPGEYDPIECADQLPFGDFTPGRYAWLLTDVTPLADPVPAKGRQGLWEWER